ncbi:hypothetical protein BU198_02610 [Streptomyces sp. CBMA156]|nr:hypothetical protein [Streptomyces sp. CBMA156]
MTRLASRRRAVMPVAVALSALVSAGVLGAGTAQATPLPKPPTTTCNPSVEPTWVDIMSYRVDPVITDYLSLYIADGTTGQRTDSLTNTDSVSTTVNNSTEIGASLSVLFVKVEAKVGFSVMKTTSTTRTSQITTTWNFNKPGKYGIYRGTRKVQGEWVKYLCAETSPTTGVWINALSGGSGSFTTFEPPEIGTVSCTTQEPAGTLRRAVQIRVGC